MAQFATKNREDALDIVQDAMMKLVEKYAKAQGMWRDATTPDPVFTSTLELDMSTVQPSLAGPKRPQEIGRAHV